MAARLLGVATGSAGGSAGIAALPIAGAGAGGGDAESEQLAVLMHELRVPTAGDARFEAEGYGSEAVDYAGILG